MWIPNLLWLSAVLSWLFAALSWRLSIRTGHRLTRVMRSLLSLLYVVPFLMLVQVVLVPSDRRKARAILHHRLSLQEVKLSDDDGKGTGGTKRRDSRSRVSSGDSVAIESGNRGIYPPVHPPILAKNSSGVSTQAIYYCQQCNGWHLQNRPRALPEHTIVDGNGQVPACTKCLSLNCMTHYDWCPDTKGNNGRDTG